MQYKTKYRLEQKKVQKAQNQSLRIRYFIAVLVSFYWRSNCSELFWSRGVRYQIPGNSLLLIFFLFLHRSFCPRVWQLFSPFALYSKEQENTRLQYTNHRFPIGIRVKSKTQHLHWEKLNRVGPRHSERPPSHSVQQLCVQTQPRSAVDNVWIYICVCREREHLSPSVL